MGNCYYYGNGVEVDYEKAAEWFTKAAEQGHAEAQYNLGFCYENGKGVPQDNEKAVEWYEKAAEQGYDDAIKKLEELKEKGESSEPQASSNKMSKEKFVGWADRTVEEVVFQNILDGAPSDAEDLSEEGDRSVLGWKDGEKLYIAGEGGVKAPEDCSYLFSEQGAGIDRSKGWTKLTAVTNAEYLDISQTKVTRAMFSNCSSLTNLDVSDWNTSNITDMCDMFAHCSSLESLGVSRWDTSNVTDMRYMFSGCSNLTDLDVSAWDTSSLVDKDYMFKGTKWEEDPPI